MERSAGLRFRRFGWLAVGGVVTAATVAILVAPAFACAGGGGSMSLSPPGAPAGAAVSVEVKGFKDPGTDLDSDVVIKWGGPNGRPLATATPNEAGNWDATFTVPTDAVVRSGARVAFYQVTAIRKKIDGTVMSVPRVFEVFPTAAAPASPPPAQPDPRTPGPAAPAPEASTLPDQSGNPAPAAPGPATTPTAGPATQSPVRGPSAQAAPPAVAGTAAPTATAPTPSPEAPAVPGAATAAPAVTTDPQQAPIAEVGVPASDLWSGLDSGRGPSLLDVAAPRQSDDAPAGIFLVGLGAAVLGGLGLAAGRRRLALARTTDWR